MSPRAASKFHLMPVRKPIDTSSLLLSPMPGLLIDVLVKEGDTVSAGDSLAIVEAMKMENVSKIHDWKTQSRGNCGQRP